jgi:CBS domain-containing protein
VKVKDVMAKEVATLKVDDELSLAEDIMHLGRIRHLPVMDGDTLKGIISERDLYKASLASAIDYDPKAKRRYMKTIAIKEVMTKDVITIGPDADIREAGRLMLHYKIGCLPVVRDGKMIGLITETDVLRYYVERDSQL